MSKYFPYENLMLEPVSRHLRHNGVRNLLSEVGFYDYRVDIYGYSKSSGLTHAVELKLSRWRRALEQALAYQLCADLVWMALPLQNTKVVDIALLEQHGIGLIGVETPSRCYRLLQPKQSPVINPHYRSFYTALLSERSNVNTA